MDRRRALMASSGVVLPPVPSGYITNGLVFFLDGKQLATASKWIDIVGGKTFQLTDCTVVGNGVDFSLSTAVGIRAGQVTEDWENETIEAVITAWDVKDNIEIIKTKSVLCQPYINNTVGISLRFGDNGATVRTAIGLDGVKRAIQHFPYKTSATPYAHRLSINTDRIVFNGTQPSGTSTTTYSKNTTGNTVLGATATTSIHGKGIGIIHAVRIYNRKLTLAEMQSNQATDLTYYNL